MQIRSFGHFAFEACTLDTPFQCHSNLMLGLDWSAATLAKQLGGTDENSDYNVLRNFELLVLLDAICKILASKRESMMMYAQSRVPL